MKNETLRKLGCILVCILIVSMSISSACAKSITKEDVDENLNNMINVNNTTNKTIKTNNTKNNTTSNYADKKWDKTREKLKTAIKNTFGANYDPLNIKDDKISFHRVHHNHDTEISEMNQVIGVLNSWIFENMPKEDPDWVLTKQNVVDLIKDVIHPEDQQYLTQWLKGKYDIFKDEDRAEFHDIEEVRSKLIKDLLTEEEVKQRYGDADEAPFYKIDSSKHWGGKALVVREDEPFGYSIYVFREMEGIISSWAMNNNVPKEYLTRSNLFELMKPLFKNIEDEVRWYNHCFDYAYDY